MLHATACGRQTRLTPRESGPVRVSLSTVSSAEGLVWEPSQGRGNAWQSPHLRTRTTYGPAAAGVARRCRTKAWISL